MAVKCWALSSDGMVKNLYNLYHTTVYVWLWCAALAGSWLALLIFFCLITSCNYTQGRHLFCKNETICVIYCDPQDPMLE